MAPPRDNDDAGEEGDRLLESISNVKRQTVPNACENCRRRKVKCDGVRPCGECLRRSLPCEFMSSGSETTRQAGKRKYGELTRLYESLRNEDEDRALQIFNRIRAGEPINTIFREGRSGSPSQPGSRQRKRYFLSFLLQTTAPLRDIVRLASRALLDDGPAIDLPEFATYEPFRNCVISIEALARAIIIDTDPGQSSSLLHGSPSSSFHVPDGFDGGPPHWVSASSWTTLSISDEGASHLVSVFLSLVNGLWRLLEQDAFLRTMRRGAPSRFCTSFLVNAILACGSLFSDIEEAYDTPGQRLTRGDHFHREALRCWAVEAIPLSIANIQALLILAMDCGIRGRDKMGWDFMTRAVAMHQTLTSQHPLTDRAMDATEQRTRQCLAWTVLWMNFSYALGLLSPFETIVSTLEDAPYDLSLILPDTVVHWYTYPLARDPIPTRMNMLMQQRCMFNVLLADLMRVLYSGGQMDRRAKLEATHALAKAAATWNGNLPDNLSYARRMPVCIFEFHGLYLTLQMTLHNRAREVFCDSKSTAQRNDPPELRAFVGGLRKNAVSFARRTAGFLRDFREMYGLMISPTAVVHATAVAASILMREMKDTQSRPRPTRVSEKARGGAAHAVAGTSSAASSSASSAQDLDSDFEECFHCLLSMGMHNLLPRAIARMIYHSAKHLHVQLPDAIVRMLFIVANAAWEPSNLHQLNSVYPNMALRGQNPGGTVEQMTDWLQKWERMGDQESSAER